MLMRDHPLLVNFAEAIWSYATREPASVLVWTNWVNYTKRYDRILDYFQAEGRGLWQKARNVQHQLDDYTSRKLEFIGAIRII